MICPSIILRLHNLLLEEMCTYSTPNFFESMNIGVSVRQSRRQNVAVLSPPLPTLWIFLQTNTSANQFSPTCLDVYSTITSKEYEGQWGYSVPPTGTFPLHSVTSVADTKNVGSGRE